MKSKDQLQDERLAKQLQDKGTTAKAEFERLVLAKLEDRNMERTKAVLSVAQNNKSLHRVYLLEGQSSKVAKRQLQEKYY